MFPKSVVLAATLLLLAQNISGLEEKRARLNSGYYEIDGVRYYLENEQFHRDVAKTRCEGRNMTLITYETSQKFEAIKDWLYYNADRKWLWSGGAKDEGSSVWYWEATGAEITEFYWASGYPNMGQNPEKATIAYNDNESVEGWGDFAYATPYRFGMLCQPK